MEENKVALITGAARGIGKAIAKKFAENGYNVVINYVSAKTDIKTLTKEFEDLGVKVLLVKADVSNKEEAQVTRIDNDSNVVSFGEKTSKQDALDIVETFITTPFSNLEKHQRRIDKILKYEEER